jgi:HTH-type transcriptional regulator, competence development regulator
MISLSDFVKERRLLKHLSMRELAQKANISHTEVYRIENGERKNPSVPILTALAKALGVPEEVMFETAGLIKIAYWNNAAPPKFTFPDMIYK